MHNKLGQGQINFRLVIALLCILIIATFLTIWYVGMDGCTSIYSSNPNLSWERIYYICHL
ncbi:MAG: hypothetical protein ABIJ34_06915 [archaeon]